MSRLGRVLGAPAVAALAVLFALSGCDKDDEIEWRQFNGPADTVTIEVGPGPLGEPLVVDLLSTTGAVVVGTATVDPARAPVGTDHLLLIEVLDRWEERVGRATITSEGPRGAEEYELRRDSADLGFYELRLTSLGAPDEERTDTWTITLWEPDTLPVADPAAGARGASGSAR